MDYIKIHFNNSYEIQHNGELFDAIDLFDLTILDNGIFLILINNGVIETIANNSLEIVLFKLLKNMQIGGLSYDDFSIY